MKSLIFKLAHAIRSQQNVSMSYALKTAWAVAKNSKQHGPVISGEVTVRVRFSETIYTYIFNPETRELEKRFGSCSAYAIKLAAAKMGGAPVEPARPKTIDDLMAAASPAQAKAWANQI